MKKSLVAVLVFVVVTLFAHAAYADKYVETKGYWAGSFYDHLYGSKGDSGLHVLFAFYEHGFSYGEITKREFQYFSGDSWHEVSQYGAGEYTYTATGDYTITYKVTTTDQSTYTDTCEVTCAEVDLDITGIDDEDESSVGKYLFINSDDDNTNNVSDNHSSETTVTGEDDLVKITLQEIEPSSLTGSILLNKTAGDTKIKVWEDTTKDTEVTLPESYNLGSLPKELYVEGVNPSLISTRDIVVSLAYTFPEMDPPVACSDAVRFTIVGVDVDAQGVDDGAEETTGLYVTVNDDDDNSNSTPDKDDTTVVGEDDLVAIEINKVLPTALTGTVTLDVTSGDSKVKLWSQQAKVTELTPPLEYTTPGQQGSFPAYVYLEGVEASDTERDIELTLSYTYNSITYTDRIKVTVVKVDLEIENVTEEDEVVKGGFIALNSDDDNNNQTADRLDGGTVVGENDLLKVTIKKVEPNDLTDTITLHKSDSAGRIKVWESSTKGTEITFDGNGNRTYTTPTDLPKDLWVEGYLTSGALRDIELAVVYNTPSSTTCEDKVKLTVSDVQLTHIKFDYSSGTSTALTSTVLTDDTANWTTNEFVGKELHPDITDDTTFTIASNTATTITISSGDMTTVANVGDKYSVVYDDDALSIREDRYTDVTLPEWATGTRNEPAAYIKDKPVTVLARFAVLPSSITSAKIKATSSDFLGNLAEQTVNFTSGVSNPQYIRFAAANNTPDEVDKDTVEWNWKYSDVNGSGSREIDVAVGLKRSSGPHTIYTLFDRPQLPWENWGINRPWYRALDYSCNFADGSDIESSIVSEIVTGIYNSGCEYDGSVHYTYPNYYQFHLQDLLDDLDSVGTDQLDCRDCANWFHTLTGSVGVQAWYRVIDRTTNPYYFITNYIFPMGAGSETTTTWNFHQIGWWNSKVGDASLRIDNDADPTSSPFTWKLVVGDMTQTTYIDKLTETPDVTDIETNTCTIDN